MLYITLMCISRFMLFLLASCYYYMWLRNDVRQKPNSNGFLIWIQNGSKAAETARNINNAFGPGTANEHTVQWWFKKFYKGDKSLEEEDYSGLPSEVDNHQLRESSKLILLQLYKKLPKNSTLTKLWSFSIRNKLEQWKSSISGCFMSWRQIKKIIILKCCLLLFYTTTRTISPSDCDVWQKVDVIGQLAMTSSVVGPRRSSEAVPKAKLTPKNRSWSLSGGLLPVWSTTAFWIPVKPLYLRSTLSNQRDALKTAMPTSWHWSTKRPQFFSTTMPNHTLHNQCFRSWMNWVTKFCLFHHIHLTYCQLTTTSSSISTAFCRENAFQECQIPKHGFLCYRNKQTFLVGKNVLIAMVPILVNKYVLELSYNDLKFTVQNHNYVCTNLIFTKLKQIYRLREWI